MCLICGLPANINCACQTPQFFYDPCPPNGCPEKIDASCVFYNLNNPFGQNNLLNINLPNGVNLKTILDRIDSLLGKGGGAGSGSGTSQDIFVKVDALDASSGYLYNKLTAGDNVSFVVLNPGGNESIQITSANNKVAVDASDNNPDYLIHKISGSSDGIITINVFDQNGVVGLQPCVDVGALLQAIINIPQYQNLFCQMVQNCVSRVTPCNPPSNLSVSIASGTASLIWTPGDITGTQTIEYKLSSSSSFTLFATVGPTVGTESIPGLSPNVNYDFRITDVCASGSTSTSIQQTGIQINCPTVTVTPTQTTALVSFAGLGGDITSYTIILYDSTGLNVIKQITLGAPFSSPITTTFTGLTAGTSYKIQVQPGNSVTTNTTCAQVLFSTTALPSCSGPTNLQLTAGSNNIAATWNGDPNANSYNLYYGVQANIMGNPPGNGWVAFGGNPIPASQTSASITGLTPGVTYSVAINSNCQNGSSSSYITASTSLENIISGAITLVNYSVPGTNDRQVNTQVNIVFSQPTPAPLTLYFGYTYQGSVPGTNYAYGWDLFSIPVGYVAAPPYHDITSNLPYFVQVPQGVTSFTTNLQAVVTINTTSIWNNDVPIPGFNNSTGFSVTSGILTNWYVKINTPSNYIANFTMASPSVPITNVN